MNRVIVTIIGIYILLYSTNVHSRDNEKTLIKTHSFSFKTQFIQIKDEFNYGLVYNGINLSAGYSYSRSSDKKMFTYTPEIAFGGVFNKGAGFVWRFKPIDLFYGSKLKSKPFTIGAYFTADYQWQQYSELQGGRLFWFSSIEVGPRISFKFPYKSYLFNISFSNSLAGFTSRPEPSTESYYYSFSFSEFFSVAHQNLKFGSFGLFNRTKFEVEMKHDTWERFSIGYGFEYFGYYQEPTLRYLNNSINLKWKI